MEVEILHDVAVSENVKAGAKVECCSYGHMSRLGDGSICVTYRRGETKHSYDGTIAAQVSRDNGLTWGEPVTVFDFLGSDPVEGCMEGNASAAGDGSLTCIVTTTVVTAEDSYIFSEEGFEQDRRYYKCHSDDGIEWSSAERLGHLTAHRFGMSGIGFLAKNGRMFFSGAVPSATTGMRVSVGLFSDDNGKTLGEPFEVVTDSARVVNYDDPNFTVFPDGTVVGLFWTFREGDEATVEVHRCVSEDNGSTWSKPVGVGMLGQIAVPLALDDNRMLVASNFRQRPDGIRLWLSNDRGLSFGDPIQMWDDGQGKMLGEPVARSAQRTRNDGVWDELQRFRFGTPDVMRLDDGTFLLSYYGTVDEVIHMRVCRFVVKA